MTRSKARRARRAGRMQEWHRTWPSRWGNPYGPLLTREEHLRGVLTISWDCVVLAGIWTRLAQPGEHPRLNPECVGSGSG